MSGPAPTSSSLPTVSELIEFFGKIDLEAFAKGINHSSKTHSNKVKILTSEGEVAFRPSPRDTK